jgi:general transcription factor 3C polypeptide 6
MSSGSSLFPGYVQVDEFGPDEDYESDEEVVYVTLDLGNDIEPSLVPRTSAYRLIVRTLEGHRTDRDADESC